MALVKNNLLNEQSIINKYIGSIDVIYWINLDRSIERYNNMIKILSIIPIKNIRISAVDGKNISDENLYSNYNFENNNRQEYRTKIEYACLLSHLNTIKRFSQSQNKIALIMEDDLSLDFVQYWDKSIDIIIKGAPNNWEIIQLSYIIGSNLPDLAKQYTLNKDHIWGAGAYIINQKGATKLMKTINSLGKKYNLDKNIKHTADNYLFASLITYVYKYPYFTYPDGNDSTIHTNNLEGHFASKKRLNVMWNNYKADTNFASIDKFMKGFDVIYWINLDRSKDRFKNMTKILSKFPVKNIRISAIDGKNMSDIELYKNYEDNTQQPDRTKIEYACLLSHLTALKTFSESNYEIALIMEDDISMDFLQYWKTPIDKVIKDAPDDWEILMLTYMINRNVPDLVDIYTLNKNGYIWSAASYLITRKAAVKFISTHFKNNKYTLNKTRKHTADDYLFSTLTTYIYKYPFFTYPDDNDSTIHNEHLQTHLHSKKRIASILDKYNSNYCIQDCIDKYINRINIIYWINLKSSKKRHDNMMEILDLFPIKHIRVEAEDGHAPNTDHIYAEFTTNEFNRSTAEYACLLSHLKTIKDFSESDNEIALIMEDDISLEFSKNWNKSVNDIIKEAPSDWEIIMLNYITDRPLAYTYTYNRGDIYSTAAYIINRKGAIRFINSIYRNKKFVLDESKIHTADEFILTSMKTYVYKYAYFTYPDNNDSTIHDNHLEFHMYSKKILIQSWEKYSPKPTISFFDRFNFRFTLNRSTIIYILIFIYIVLLIVTLKYKI
jgi:GR25 family glycosyltransferase involved in LPS biosynthesis